MVAETEVLGFPACIAVGRGGGAVWGGVTRKSEECARGEKCRAGERFVKVDVCVGDYGECVGGLTVGDSEKGFVSYGSAGRMNGGAQFGGVEGLEQRG